MYFFISQNSHTCQSSKPRVLATKQQSCLVIYKHLLKGISVNITVCLLETQDIRSFFSECTLLCFNRSVIESDQVRSSLLFSYPFWFFSAFSLCRVAEEKCKTVQTCSGVFQGRAQNFGYPQVTLQPADFQSITELK